MFLSPSVLCIFPGTRQANTCTHKNTRCDTLLGVTGQNGIYDVSVRLKGKEIYGSLQGGWIDTQNWHVHKLSFPLLDFSFILRVFSASSLRVHFWFGWMCPRNKKAGKWLWMFHSDAPIITITKDRSNSNCDKNTLSKEITFQKKNKKKKNNL